MTHLSGNLWRAAFFPAFLRQFRFHFGRRWKFFLLYLCVDCLEQAKKTKAVFTYYKHTEIVSNLWSSVREAYASVFYHLPMLATLFKFSCLPETQECCMRSRTNFKVKSWCFCWTPALPVSMAINAVGSLNLKLPSWINKAQAEWNFFCGLVLSESNISRMSRMRTKGEQQTVGRV